MNVDAIPTELRELSRWIVWRWGPVDPKTGKPKKPPYCPDDLRRHASSTNAATWATFDKAVAVVQAGEADGIGFALTKPYVGVDLDDELPAPDHGAVMAALDSYSETSPSGAGHHVVIRASLNGQGRHPPGIGVFQEARLFYFTGAHVTGTPETIEHRQAELEEVLAHYLPRQDEATASDSRPTVPVELDDHELLERMFASKSGSKIHMLWDGDTFGYPSQSEADLALLAYLAWWTDRDGPRMEAMFRRSALYREEGPQKPKGAGYLARTIAAAIAATPEGYRPRREEQGRGSDSADSARSAEEEAEASTARPSASDEDAFRLEPVDWQALAKQGPPALEYLLPPFLPKRKRIWGVGAGESGKSIWAAAKSADLSRTGEPVVYVSQENGLEEEARRFLRLRPDFEHLRLYVDQGLDLTIAEHRDALFAVTEGAALVVLDTFTACWSGDEDSNAALTEFDRDVLKPLQAAGASTLVLDHTGNPQPNVRRRGVSAPRGASAKGQKTDFLLEFKETGDGSFRVERGKKRGTHGKEPRDYRVVDADDGTLELVETEAEERDLAGEIAELLEEGDWLTANKIKQPKGKGGIGADVNAVKDALDDERFESAAGPTIGKRKGSTYYRLKEAS